MLECNNCKYQTIFRRKAKLCLEMEVNQNKVPVGEENERIVSIVYICPRCGAEVGREDND
jgi:hypothetical protein